MRFLPALLIAALLAVVIAGCGSSGGDSTTDAVTKASYIQAGDAICKQANAELQAAQKQVTSQSQIKGFVTETMVPNIQGQLDALKALPAPSGDQEKLTTLYDTLQADLDKLKADPLAIQDALAFADANSLAQDYGFKVCGGSPS